VIAEPAQNESSDSSTLASNMFGFKKREESRLFPLRQQLPCGMTTLPSDAGLVIDLGRRMAALESHIFGPECCDTVQNAAEKKREKNSAAHAGKKLALNSFPPGQSVLKGCGRALGRAPTQASFSLLISWGSQDFLVGSARLSKRTLTRTAAPMQRGPLPVVGGLDVGDLDDRLAATVAADMSRGRVVCRLPR